MRRERLSGAGRVTDEIIRLASSSKAKERNEAVKRLKNLKLGEADYSRILWQLLGMDNEYARRTAVKAVPVLLRNNRDIILFSKAVLQDESWQVREAGANILRNLTEVRGDTLKLLESYSRDRAPIVNRTAGDTMAHLHLKGLVDIKLVESLAKSSLPAERRTAAFCLKRLEKSRPEILELVREWALHGGENEKWTAVYALKLIGKNSRDAVEILKMVEGSHEVSRLKAKALREVGEE